jgi:hypothetical protein
MKKSVVLGWGIVVASVVVASSLIGERMAVAEVMADTLRAPASLQLVATVTTDSASATFPDTLNLTVNWTGVAHAKGYRVTVVTGVWNPPGTQVTVGGGTHQLKFRTAQRSDVQHFKVTVVTVAVCAFGPDKVLRDSACAAHRWYLARPAYLK